MLLIAVKSTFEFDLAAAAVYNNLESF